METSDILTTLLGYPLLHIEPVRLFYPTFNVDHDVMSVMKW
jgi:hypothetical protein